MSTFRQLAAVAVSVAAMALASPVVARDITHAMGVTEVPDHPQRIVVLTNEGTEALLAIGVKPVGAVESWKGNPWYDYLMPQMDGVTFLGTEGAPDLELIASLEPDLILGSKVRQEKIYEQLSAIAPTVTTETLGAPWKENLAVYADAVGKAAEGEAALAAFETRVADLRTALGDAVNDTISLVRISPARTRMYLKDSFPGAIVDAIGFKRPATQDRNEFAEDLTRERIGELAADRIFYFSPDPTDSEAEANVADWIADPLWLNLDAVRAGQALRVDDGSWVAAGGIFAANIVLDDIQAAYGLPSSNPESNGAFAMFLRLAATLAAVALLSASVSAREITHAMGVTDVPDNPQRIVVLTNEGTEALLAVGITPVGAVKSFLGDPWYDHIAEQMVDVTVVGEESALNLEAIAALQPDLIIGNKTRQEKVYEQLSAIAPTVMAERLRGDWKINMALYTDAAGKGEEGAAALAAFDARAAKLAQEAGPLLDEEISLIRYMSGLTRIYYLDTFSGLILKQIGFHRPAAQDNPAFADDVGKERIPDFEGDRLFYFVYETGDGAGNAQEADWTADPLWQSLDVVKAGKAYKVDDAVWNTAGGIIAANLMLDDLEKFYELPSTR